MGEPLSGERGTVRAADGHEIAVTRFRARGRPWAAMVYAPAMGVRQDFYAPFAAFMAEHGVEGVSFDYRGMGFSRRGRLSRFQTDVTTWAERDLPAILDEAQRAAPGAPLALAGHSLGGQILGLAPDNERVKAALTVCAGSGYYRLNERMRWKVRFLWFAAMPSLVPLFGYFPGKRLRVVGDLPAGVARQWRRWCLHPGYFAAEGEHTRASCERVRAPVLAYSFEDDDMITGTAVDQLHGFLRNAAVDRRHVRPADVGARRIGHFGFFAPHNRIPLWVPTLQWLRRSLGSVPGQTPDSAERNKWSVPGQTPA